MSGSSSQSDNVKVPSVQNDIKTQVKPNQKELEAANKVIDMVLQKAQNPSTTSQPRANFLDLVELLENAGPTKAAVPPVVKVTSTTPNTIIKTNSTPRKLTPDEQLLAALLGGNLLGQPSTTQETKTKSRLTPEEQLLAALLSPQLPRTVSTGKTATTTVATTVKPKPQTNGQKLTDAQLLAALLAINQPQPNTKKPINSATSTSSSQRGIQILSPDTSFTNPINIDLADDGTPRGQGLVKAAIEVTKAVSQFMNIVIQGASQQFQNFFRSGTNLLTNYFSIGSLQSSSGS